MLAYFHFVRSQPASPGLCSANPLHFYRQVSIGLINKSNILLFTLTRTQFMSLVAGTSTRIAISHAHSNILINELLDRQDSALLAFTLVFMSLYKELSLKFASCCKPSSQIFTRVSFYP